MKNQRELKQIQEANNMYKIKQTEIDFFKSALAKDSDVISILKILEWIKAKNGEVNNQIEQIPLDKMRLWKFDEITGNIVHESRRFFSIEGIRVETNWGNVPMWEQPIINQPEIGFLGILAKKINGILHFLMQAKIEPGNLNTVQISPRRARIAGGDRSSIRPSRLR